MAEAAVSGPWHCGGCLATATMAASSSGAAGGPGLPSRVLDLLEHGARDAAAAEAAAERTTHDPAAGPASSPAGVRARPSALKLAASAA